jgi:hypothetical protein
MSHFTQEDSIFVTDSERVFDIMGFKVKFIVRPLRQKEKSNVNRNQQSHCPPFH